MRYRLTPHAEKRMRERAISLNVVRDCLQNPDKVSYDEKGRYLLKKRYDKSGKQRLLMIAVERKGGVQEVITVIDTSKVKKYL